MFNHNNHHHNNKNNNNKRKKQPHQRPQPPQPPQLPPSRNNGTRGVGKYLEHGGEQASTVVAQHIAVKAQALEVAVLLECLREIVGTEAGDAGLQARGGNAAAKR